MLNTFLDSAISQSFFFNANVLCEYDVTLLLQMI